MAEGKADSDWLEEKIERYRYEPYHLFSNNCIHKSLRLRQELKGRGINANVVLLLFGLGKARIPIVSRLLGRIPFPALLHAYVEINGKRIEVSRPLGEEGFLGFINEEIKPILKVKL